MLSRIPYKTSTVALISDSSPVVSLSVSLVARGVWWEGGKRGRESLPPFSLPIPADDRVKFSLWKHILYSRSITLAFLYRPWVNRRETRGLSVCLGHKIVKHQHIVKLWVNFPKIFFKLWKATNKLNFLSDRWLHHLVSIPPLTVVPPSSPLFLALVKNTIRCKNY